MILPAYTPTDEQRRIMMHDGAAFVMACPGAGKTRTMVERARYVLHQEGGRRGVAFLSFTNAAIAELEERLVSFGVLSVPLFPNFIGTFDRFLWQFFIIPFGIPECDHTPTLVPNKNDWEVVPFNGAQSLKLKCFDRLTGNIDSEEAKKMGFDVAKRNITPYQTTARSIIQNAKDAGKVDFEDIRTYVQGYLTDTTSAKHLGAALAARFREVVIDEAQDCNPTDLAVVDWLRRSGITIKIICDPNQSIYGFRGGVTDELEKFADTFATDERLLMSGNFRSTPAICAAIVALRPPSANNTPDKPLGRNKSDLTPVHILSYNGTAITQAIGAKFRTLVERMNIPLCESPILASTNASASKAIGQPSTAKQTTNNKTRLLAMAAMDYHFSFTMGDRREALVGLHKIILLVKNNISTLSGYQDYLLHNGLNYGQWRSEIIAIANGLQFNPTDTGTTWLGRARALLDTNLVGLLSINQRLPNDKNLEEILTGAPKTSPPARTIHSAKGLEFPAVCVVMTNTTAGSILAHLEGQPSTNAEEVRKIYVAASRAERLLAIAIPESKCQRLQTLLTNNGCPVSLHQI